MISTQIGHLLIIGGGAIGRALFDGWVKSGWKPDSIAIIDRDPARCVGEPKLLLGEACRPNLTIIAVKPHHVAPALKDYALFLRAGDFIVSIAAGIELATLRGLVPAGIHVFRAMPNLPVRVGKGTICLCHPEDAQSEGVGAVRDALSKLGLCTVLDETLIDAFTAMAGSGPAYFYAFIEHFAAAGQAVDLSLEVSRKLALQVFVGAASLLEMSEMTPTELRTLVTSPAGTTAAGLDALNRDNELASLLNACVAAAKARSRELSGEKPATVEGSTGPYSRSGT